MSEDNIRGRIKVGLQLWVHETQLWREKTENSVWQNMDWLLTPVMIIGSHQLQMHRGHLRSRANAPLLQLGSSRSFFSFKNPILKCMCSWEGESLTSLSANTLSGITLRGGSKLATGWFYTSWACPYHTWHDDMRIAVSGMRASEHLKAPRCVVWKTNVFQHWSRLPSTKSTSVPPS